jgi:hypothetical protein
MIPESVREAPNPYILTPRLSPSKFVGREYEVDKLRRMLDEYSKSFKLKNMMVSGEKSIGKSTLMNRYKQVLEDYNFVVYETELHRDSSVAINEFEFFKDLINELFEKYAPPEGSFFEAEQSEIWFSLTSGNYHHQSDFKERLLTFPTQYANYKKGIPETLSFKQLEKDFEKILGQLISKDMEILGLAILVDEFQELSRNVVILDLLRQLSENLPGLTVIGAGLPTFLDNAMFEKFVRTAEPTPLRAMSREEILNLVLEPLQDIGPYKKFELRTWFEPASLQNILARSGGNPLHVRIICSKMFDYYKKRASVKMLELNRAVMEEVMAYYSQISEKSNRIRQALEPSSRDQLSAFSLLYQYQGLSIRSAMLAHLAFQPITPESEARARSEIISALDEVWDLGLFEFKDASLTLNAIESMSASSLSRVEIKFIGDTIDKLYAYYFYEALTERKLVDRAYQSLEDVLADKLGKELRVVFAEEGVSVAEREMLTRVTSAPDDKEQHVTDFVSDLDSLSELKPEEFGKDEVRKRISAIAQKRDLRLVAFLTSLLDYQGYLFVAALANIRGKARLIVDLLPVRDVVSIPFKSKRVTSPAVQADTLEQYLISVDSIYICWVPKQPLLFIRTLDVSDLNQALFDAVAKRDFERGVELAASAWTLDLKVSEGKMLMFPVVTFNNFGFCLMHVNMSEARDIFEKCEPKFLLSSVNLAYTWFIENNLDEAKKHLNNIVRRQIGKDHEARFIHLAIGHPSLPLENRIVEDVSVHNIACWNMALIATQQEKNRAIANSYMKRTVLKKNEGLIQRRVRYWITYYQGGISAALTEAKKLAKDCASIPYLCNDIRFDIAIFEREIQPV